jgi:hypothetical protein
MHSGTRPRRRRRLLWIVAGLVAAGVIFGLGVALGQSLEDNPEPGPGSTTIVRTLTVPTAP